MLKLPQAISEYFQNMSQAISVCHNYLIFLFTKFDKSLMAISASKFNLHMNIITKGAKVLLFCVDTLIYHTFSLNV